MMTIIIILLIVRIAILNLVCVFAIGMLKQVGCNLIEYNLSWQLGSNAISK
jgi:hypothetical protein